MYRLAAIGVLAMTVATSSVATAQSAASNERAYTLTLMCHAVAVAFGTEAEQERTLDASRKMARAQGFSDQRLSDDSWNMLNVVRDRIHNQSSEVSRDREICRRMGLVS